MRYQNSDTTDIGERTRELALRVINLFRSLPKTTEAEVMGKQMLRSGTSVGAHIAESRRARSSADFANKLDGALQELEETRYWLDLIIRSAVVPPDRLASLEDEINQIMAIMVTLARKTLQSELD